MNKIKTSFSINPEVLELLKKLAAANDRSSASMLEVLIKEAAIKEKIKTLKS